jgi:hypothetical protein
VREKGFLNNNNIIIIMFLIEKNEKKMKRNKNIKREIGRINKLEEISSLQKQKLIDYIH